MKPSTPLSSFIPHPSSHSGAPITRRRLTCRTARLKLMKRITGGWRSWLAHQHDTLGVTGSSPVPPITLIRGCYTKPKVRMPLWLIGALLMLAWPGCLAADETTAVAKPATRPWLGVHVGAGGKKGLEKFSRCIPGLGKLGVNALVLEIDYGFEFESRPEMRSEGGISKVQAKEFAQLCRAN